MEWLVHVLEITQPYEQRLITCGVIAFCMLIIAYEALPGHANEALINLAFTTIWVAGGFHVAKGVVHILAPKSVK